MIVKVYLDQWLIFKGVSCVPLKFHSSHWDEFYEGTICSCFLGVF